MPFADLYSALWERRLFIAVSTCVLIAITALLTLDRQEQYEARSVVRVQSVSEGGANERLQAAQGLARTYADLISGGALDARIERIVRQRLASPHGEQLEFGAEQEKDLAVLTLTARGADPNEAAIGVEAIQSALRELASRSSGGERMVIVSAARPPGSPSSPNLMFNLAFAFVVGLILNSALALAGKALFDRVPDADRLESELSLPVLAVIPRVRFTGRVPARFTGTVPSRFARTVSTRSGSARGMQGTLVPSNGGAANSAAQEKDSPTP
jgi:capsular polysaccharide biosynthesis protein